MELEKRIDDMLTEMLNDIYNDTRNVDTEFDAKIKMISELSEVEQKIRNVLTSEEYEKYEELVGLRQEAEMQMQKEAYRQGAKDCVTVLRKVGVI